MATQTDNTKSATAFSKAKQSIVIRPRANNIQAFIYHDFTDLKNLVRFVGTKPQIDEEGNLYFRNTLIPDNTVIMRDAYGRVIDVMTYDQANGRYEIVAESEFKPEHANKVIAKEKTAGKANGGMTRTELKDALTKAKVVYKNGLTKDQLQEVYDSAKLGK
jgi:hypothetical protein